MSVIVAVRKNDRTVMAADSLTCFGDAQRVSASNSITPKIKRLGASIVGGSGWAVYDCILDDFLADGPPPALGNPAEIFAFFLDLWKAMHDRYTMVNDQAGSKDTPFGDLDASFLIASPAGIFKVSHDMDVSRFEQYFAIGSGAEYALGAMHNLYGPGANAEAIARGAVETAMEFDLYCGGTIDVLSL